MPDGERPKPGGWNRIHLVIDDLPAEVARLRAAGVKFRNDIVTGPGGDTNFADGSCRQTRGVVSASQTLRSVAQQASLTIS
jgi:hypothetical protein